MKLKLSLIFPVLIIAGVAQSIMAQPKGAALEPPDAVVRALYRVHNNGRGPVFVRASKKNITRFFDKELADLIWRELNHQPEDEVGNLDFDPLYNAQDTKIARFTVGQPQLEQDKATVVVSFRNFGQPNKLTYRLRRTDAGWKISNIDYGADSDLIKILSESH